jgi:hypothetical protein
LMNSKCWNHKEHEGTRRETEDPETKKPRPGGEALWS